MQLRMEMSRRALHSGLQGSRTWLPLGGQEMVVSSLLDTERMYKLMKEMFIFK